MNFQNLCGPVALRLSAAGAEKRRKKYIRMHCNNVIIKAPRRSFAPVEVHATGWKLAGHAALRPGTRESATAASFNSSCSFGSGMDGVRQLRSNFAYSVLQPLPGHEAHGPCTSLCGPRSFSKPTRLQRFTSHTFASTEFVSLCKLQLHSE